MAHRPMGALDDTDHFHGAVNEARQVRGCRRSLCVRIKCGGGLTFTATRYFKF
jgi:hypothetical protein